MTGAWAACVAAAIPEHLGRLRLEEGLQVACQGEETWLRGPDIQLPVYEALRRIPTLRRFRLDADDQLYLGDDRLPSGVLPNLRWQPIREFVTVAASDAQYTPPSIDKITLALVRADRADEQPPNLMITSAAAFGDWAVDAPAFRLQPLRFAADADGRIVILGTPLPPIAGRRFLERQDVAVPCGYTWAPAVPAGVVRQVLRLGAQELALATTGRGTYPSSHRS